MNNAENDQWTDHIGYVLLTYNHTMINSTTHMTPYEARKPQNQLMVKKILQQNLNIKGYILILILLIWLIYIQRKSQFIKNMSAFGLKIRMRLKI